MSNQVKALSEVRAYAKNLGMTFKRQNATINGKTAYLLTNRKTGVVLAKNLTVSTAYEEMLSGYFEPLGQNI